ncbi:MAG TPA: GcrA family cell cycle regulator [Xanthobacteraceae bacterium]|nr:GcrA family cell cycle regulator [Xanthobacteraceae bacterium]
MTEADDIPILQDQSPPPGDAAVKRARFAWSAAHIALVRQRWSEGASAASIAKELGEAVSRCAVLGKIHRLKLAQPEFKQRHPRKETAVLKRKRAPRPARARAVRAPSALMAAFQALGLGKGLSQVDLGGLHQHAGKAFGPACGLMDLDAATCRWPLGEPNQSDFVFCGAAPFRRYPYCLVHCLIAYRPDAADDKVSATQAPMRPAVAPQSCDESRRRAA